jgi:hypothetical protein
MPVQASNPVATTATEIAMYVLQTGITHNIFIRSPNSAVPPGGKEYQMTRLNDANFATFGTFTNYPPNVVNQDGGWTFLPGGLLMQYGTASSNAATVTVNFPVSFTTTNISVVVTNNANSGNSTGVGNITNAKFDMFRGGSSTVTVRWIAVGI